MVSLQERKSGSAAGAAPSKRAPHTCKRGASAFRRAALPRGCFWPSVNVRATSIGPCP